VVSVYMLMNGYQSLNSSIIVKLLGHSYFLRRLKMDIIYSVYHSVLLCLNRKLVEA
jgi:hypothetical protein